jgi:hypothetical protein
VLRGEEEEAVRLQAQRAARLGEDDYGLDDLAAPPAAQPSAAPAAGRGKGTSKDTAAPGARRGRGVEVEAVTKDLSALTKGGFSGVRGPRWAPGRLLLCRGGLRRRPARGRSGRHCA